MPGRVTKKFTFKVALSSDSGLPRTPKPAYTRYECATYNKTRQVWEIRVKDQHALEAAGLRVPTTKTTTSAASYSYSPGTSVIGSRSSSSSSLYGRLSPTAATITTATTTTTPSPPPTLPKKKAVFKPVLLRPAPSRKTTGTTTANKGPTRQELLAKQARIARALEGVDERLLACSSLLVHVKTDEELKKEAEKAEEDQERGRSLTKRDACSMSKCTGRGFVGRRY